MGNTAILSHMCRGFTQMKCLFMRQKYAALFGRLENPMVGRQELGRPGKRRASPSRRQKLSRHQFFCGGKSDHTCAWQVFKGLKKIGTYANCVSICAVSENGLKQAPDWARDKMIRSVLHYLLRNFLIEIHIESAPCHKFH